MENLILSAYVLGLVTMALVAAAVLRSWGYFLLWLLACGFMAFSLAREAGKVSERLGSEDGQAGSFYGSDGLLEGQGNRGAAPREDVLPFRGLDFIHDLWIWNPSPLYGCPNGLELHSQGPAQVGFRFCAGNLSQSPKNTHRPRFLGGRQNIV
jgi:hypothetical protein